MEDVYLRISTDRWSVPALWFFASLIINQNYFREFEFVRKNIATKIKTKTYNNNDHALYYMELKLGTVLELKLSMDSSIDNLTI